MARILLKNEKRTMRAYLEGLLIAEGDEIVLMEHAGEADLEQTVYLAISSPVTLSQRIIMSKVYRLPMTFRPTAIIHAVVIQLTDDYPNGSVRRDVSLEYTTEGDGPAQCGASVAFVNTLTPLQADYTKLTTDGEIDIWNNVFNWRAACLRGGGASTPADLLNMHPQIFGVAS